MLGKLFDMNNTTYITVPCLRNGYSSKSQPKSTTMYSSWKEPEQVENIHPKLSGSWTKICENFEDGDRYFDQQRNTKQSSREFGPDLKGDKDMGETSLETSLETPQFQVTIEKPVRQFLSVTSNNWRHSRRASDGAIFAPNPSGRAERRFGVLAEETAIHPVNSQVPTNRSSTGLLSTTPLTRNRRASVDCLSRVRKVSVVVPQPRNKEETGLRQIKSSENLNSISFDGEDTSWRELVAKAKGFRPSKSAETSPIDHRAKSGEFMVEARVTNSSAETDQLDRKNSTNRRSSDSSSNLNVRPNTAAVVAVPTSTSSVESERSSVVAKESLSDSEDIKRGQIEVGDVRKKTRRFSVATVRPAHSFVRTNGQKVSGYSTHGTLEYARQLLGKLQTEGRSKSKKARLDELSKALKWILEELNRIEVPDRDLVSIFISLRAKIVNLKAEVKAEERDLSSVDLESMGRMSQILTASEDKPRNVYSRRFSWC